jgi:hypothetical protein
MPDKFPEAFKRLEQKVNIDNIETFQQLNLVVGSWAGRKWVPTRLQMDALHREAKRLGIPTHGYRTREEEVHRIFGQSARETRVAIAQQKERRFSMNYVNHHEWLNNNTKTTPYQRRIINYLRNHPNASLAEARGHRAKKS